jgi:hypothetical protein
MQINTIRTVAPLVAANSSAAPANSAKVAKSATAAPSATSSAGQASKSASGQAAPPPQSEASAVSTATSTLVSTTYSTSVGGKSYSASISQANGVYTLSVPNVPGAHVSGSSLNAAESELTVKIDTLV